MFRCCIRSVIVLRSSDTLIDIVVSKSVANPWRDPKIAVLAGQKAVKRIQFLTAFCPASTAIFGSRQGFAALLETTIQCGGKFQCVGAWNLGMTHLQLKPTRQALGLPRYVARTPYYRGVSQLDEFLSVI
jgi:hypothetical protein